MIRLDEISRPESLAEANEALRKHGYEQLGEGTYGYVWAKPGASTVLKIFTRRDEAYIDYANFVMKHQDNPHFPRLSGKLIWVTNDWRAVRMERLEPFHGEGLVACVDTYISMRNSSWYPVENKDYWKTILKTIERYPLLRTACDLIIDNLIAFHGNDVHGDNMMARGQVPVLTDPVA